MRFVIPGQLPDLNQTIAASKKHWKYYAAEKRCQTHRVAWLVRAAGLSPITRPVTIKFNWICKDQRKDKDNVRFAAKYILDGLVLAGVLADDGWSHITGFEDRFGVDAKNPRIEVEVI
jgi:Holliday junction resolvase RusA-like endonuclease